MSSRILFWSILVQHNANLLQKFNFINFEKSSRTMSPTGQCITSDGAQYFRRTEPSIALFQNTENLHLQILLKIHH